MLLAVALALGALAVPAAVAEEASAANNLCVNSLCSPSTPVPLECRVQTTLPPHAGCSF